MLDKKVIELMSFETVGEAEIYRSLLESAGVRAEIQNELTAGMFPTGGGLLKVRLWVSYSDEARARDILSGHFDQAEFLEGTK